MALSTSQGPIGTLSSFKVENQLVDYHVYNVQRTAAPENTIGDVGDLYRDGSGRVWIKAENGWFQGENEVTQHPYLPVFLVFSSRAKKPRWVVKSTLRGRKFKAKDTHHPQKRLREEEEEEQEEQEEQEESSG